MVKIVHQVYVGDQDDAEQVLRNKKDFAVATMTKEGPVGHRSMLGYQTLGAPKNDDYYYVISGKHFAGNLIDVSDPAFIPEEVINPALDFIKKHYDNGEKVLIHCEQGHSRGPTTALLFLRLIGEMPYSFTSSCKIFKSLYPKFEPGNGMLTYARNHWKELGIDYDKSISKSGS